MAEEYIKGSGKGKGGWRGGGRPKGTTKNTGKTEYFTKALTKDEKAYLEQCLIEYRARYSESC